VLTQIKIDSKTEKESFDFELRFSQSLLNFNIEKLFDED